MEDDEVTVAIQRCQAGDIEGLAVLIRRFQQTAQQLALLLTGNRTQAEDLVQDSFLQAYRAIRQFRAGAAFLPWLYRIITNLARNHHRSGTAHPEISLNLMLEQGHEADLRLIEAQQRLPDPAEAAEQGEEHHDYQ